MRKTSATYKTNIAKRTKRRTFAKVIVDYTDPFLDPSIVVTPSGTAHASYPDQIANGKKDPTRKWFCLNGNCLLDGTNYLMPPTSDTASEATTEVGWWSNANSIARSQFARYKMDEALPVIPDNAAGTEYLSDFSANVDGFKPAINENIFAHWALDETFADIPDNAAGTLYTNVVDWTTGVGSWAIAGGGTGSVAIAGAHLVWTPGAGETVGVVAKGVNCTGKMLIVKVKYDALLTGVQYRNATAYVSMNIVLSGGYYYCYGLPASALSASTYIRLVFSSTPTDGQIKWIYVGTGARDINPADSSGNGNTLALYGGRSVAGLSGNGVYLDGVASYARTASVLASVPDVWHFHMSFPNGHASSTTRRCLINYRATTGGSLTISRLESGAGADNLILQSFNGALALALTFTNIFLGYSTARIDIDITVNWATFGVSVYRNGVAFDTSQSMITPTKPAVGEYIYIGGYQGTSNYLLGTIDEVRVYSRALTQAEITNLYANVAGLLAVASSELVTPKFSRGIYQKAFFSAADQLARFIIDADNAESAKLYYEQSGAWAGEETIALSAGENIIDKYFDGTTTGLKIVGALTGEIRVSAIYIGTGARDDDLVNTLGTGGDVSVNGCLHETIGGHDYIRFPTAPNANSGVSGNIAEIALTGFTRGMVINFKMFFETIDDIVDQTCFYSFDGDVGIGTFFIYISGGYLCFAVMTKNTGFPAYLTGKYLLSDEIESEHDYTFKIDMDDATNDAIQIYVDNVKKTLTYDATDATRPNIPDQTLWLGAISDLTQPSNMLIRELSIFPGTLDAYEVADLITNGYITFGYFASNPSVEETFSARTVENLIVSGESEFAEFPQAFTIELYNVSNTLLHTETVIDNAGVHWTKAIAVHAGVVKAVLTINRWSKIGRYTKILEFRPSTYREYLSSDIMSLDMLEESEVESASLPIGNLSSRQLTVRLDNHDRSFDAGSADPISAMLKPRRRVTAYLGALGTGGAIEYIPLGVFWTKEWIVPDEDIYVETVAFDLLDVMGQKETYNLGLLENKTLFDIIDAACTDFGLDSTQYVIDAALDVDVIPYAYFDRAISHREAIRIAAEAGLARVYIDRDGVLHVEGPDYLKDNKVSSDKTIAKSAYFRRSNPSRWSEVRNVIKVTTQPMVEQAAADVYTQDDITVPASGSITVSAKYSAPPVIDAAASLTTPPGGVSITSATYYPWGADIVITNSNGTDQLADLVINGKPLIISGIATLEARDAGSIIEFGELLYEFSDNVLVQTRAQAQAIADKILEYYAQGKRDLTQEWRGDPALELGDRITTDDSRTTADDYWIVRQSLTWDGALSASHDARRAT